MEDSNCVGFQNYQPVTTKEILYSVIKLQEEKENKNLCSWAWTINLDVEALSHIAVTEQ